LCKEELRAKASLVGCDTSVQLLTIRVKGNLDSIGLKPSSIARSGSPSGPREVHLLYHMNFGMERALKRSDMVR